MEKNNDPIVAEIVIERPTGPRLTVAEPLTYRSRAVATVSKTSRSVAGIAVTVGAAGLALLTRHKFATALGSTAIMAVTTHLMVASMMMGIIGDKKPSGGAPAYTGPGDVVSGAKFWIGLRAYSNATIGNNVVNVCATDNTHCANFVSGSDGKLVYQTVNGNDCSTSGTCRIQTFWDQSGANSCSGSACDETQTTFANMDLLIPSCAPNGGPCARAAGNSYTNASGLSSITQTYTIVFVAERTPATAAAQVVAQFVGPACYYSATLQQVEFFAGVAPVDFTFSGSEPTFISAQCIGNAASSTIYVNGSPSGTLNPGSTSLGGGGGALQLQAAVGGGSAFTGNFQELGAWQLDFTLSSRSANMDSNTRTFWGF